MLSKSENKAAALSLDEAVDTAAPDDAEAFRSLVAMPWHG